MIQTSLPVLSNLLVHHNKSSDQPYQLQLPAHQRISEESRQHRDTMSILSPHIQHEIEIRISDAPPEVLFNKQQTYDSRSPNLGSSKIQSRPIALPNPPRPPTPGPPPRPEPNPPVPPVPTPPPSPHTSLICSSSPQQLPPILISGSEPGFNQCPYPNPPPSPGPRRPGPVNPRPNVPTPPPSPRRSVTVPTGEQDPWVLFSTASSFAILVLEYLYSSATWNEQAGTTYEGSVSTAAWNGMTYGPNGKASDNRVVHKVPLIVAPQAKLLSC
ncbi:hypothetical protein F4680DRAFT_264991 [Xylaria scruposa]|nr:hypothetical protein F4680DRAFT_264991 [Xylaria scruposa]